MILGSHNSWSYLRPKHWWQRLFAFTARCQRKTIHEQYELGVRCFDLRLRYVYVNFHVVHNGFDYGQLNDVVSDLMWLNEKGDVSVRVIHDVRRKNEYCSLIAGFFSLTCQMLEENYPNIKFWCGRNLYNWAVDHDFEYKPKCTEMYSSVCSPELIDDWWPWYYAHKNNAWIKRDEYKEDEILLIDFVDIG